MRRRREMLGLSREALGARAGGVARSTIQRIEGGEVSAHRTTIAALLTALEIRVPVQRDHNQSAGAP